MVNKDNFDLGRVKSFLDTEPDCTVIIIANGKRSSEDYWNRIKGHLNIDKKAWLVTNSPSSFDGIPIADSLVLKVGRWWENKNAREFMLHTSLAKLVLPITFIPPFMKGGENDK